MDNPGLIRAGRSFGARTPSPGTTGCVLACKHVRGYAQEEANEDPGAPELPPVIPIRPEAPRRRADSCGQNVYPCLRTQSLEDIDIFKKGPFTESSRPEKNLLPHHDGLVTEF
jgi:hypothetical protein